MGELSSTQRRRIRILYSLSDVQLALSAADFMLACDPNEKISKVELRRFKCYETTAVVAYARPFSDSRGSVPRLSLKMVGVRLNDKQQLLHDQIITLRNRVVAHSDAEMMRMAVRVHDIDIGNGETFPFINTVFDEGLQFVGLKSVTDMLELFNVVFSGIFRTLIEDAKTSPKEFDFRHDYLNLDDQKRES